MYSLALIQKCYRNIKDNIVNALNIFNIFLASCVYLLLFPNIQQLWVCRCICVCSSFDLCITIVYLELLITFLSPTNDHQESFAFQFSYLGFFFFFAFENFMYNFRNMHYIHFSAYIPYIWHTVTFFL